MAEHDRRTARWLAAVQDTLGDDWRIDAEAHAAALEVFDLTTDPAQRDAVREVRIWALLWRLIREDSDLSLPPRPGLAGLSSPLRFGHSNPDWIAGVLRDLCASQPPTPAVRLVLGVLEGRDAAEAAVRDIPRSSHEERRAVRAAAWATTLAGLAEVPTPTAEHSLLLAAVAHLAQDHAAALRALDRMAEVAVPGRPLQADAYRRSAGLQAQPLDRGPTSMAAGRAAAALTLERGFRTLLATTGRPAVELLSDLTGIVAFRFDGVPALESRRTEVAERVREEALAAHDHAQLARRLWEDACAVAPAPPFDPTAGYSWTAPSAGERTLFWVITTAAAVAGSSESDPGSGWESIVSDGVTYLNRYPGSSPSRTIGQVVALGLLELGDPGAALDRLLAVTQAVPGELAPRQDTTQGRLVARALGALPTVAASKAETLLVPQLGPDARAATALAVVEVLERADPGRARALLEAEVRRALDRYRESAAAGGRGARDTVAEALRTIVRGLADRAYHGAAATEWTALADSILDADPGRADPDVFAMLWRRARWHIERASYEVATADALRYGELATSDAQRQDAQRLLRFVADAQESADEREAVTALAQLGLEQSAWLDRARPLTALYGRGLIERARALHRLGRQDDAAKVARDAIRQLAERAPSELAAAVGDWVGFAARHGRSSDPSWIDELGELRDLIDAEKQPDPVLAITWRLAYAREAAGDVDGALGEAELMLALATNAAATSAKRCDALVLGMASAAWARSAGREAQARALATRVLEVRADGGFHEAHEFHAGLMEARALLVLERDDEARRTLRELPRPAATAGLTATQRGLQQERAGLQLAHGWDDDAAAGWLDALAAIGDEDGLPAVMSIVGQAEDLTAEGFPERAAALLEATADFAATPEAISATRSALGEACGEQGRLDEAMGHLEVAVSAAPHVAETRLRGVIAVVTAARYFRYSGDAPTLRVLLAIATEAIRNGARLSDDQLSTLGAIGLKLGIPDLAPELTVADAPPPVRTAADLADRAVFHHLTRDGSRRAKEVSDQIESMGLTGGVARAELRELLRWIGRIRKLELAPDAPPLAVLTKSWAEAAWTIAWSQAWVSRRASLAGRIIRWLDRERAAPALRLPRRLVRAALHSAAGRRWIEIPPDRKAERILRALRRGLDLAERLPVTTARLLYVDILGLADAHASTLKSSRKRAHHLHWAIDRAIPHALQIDARAATSIDVDLRERLLSSSADIWAVAVSLSLEIEDDRLTSEIVAVRRASLVLDAAPVVALPRPASGPSEDELDAAESLADSDVVAIPGDVTGDDLAIAASGALLSAVDHRGIPVRPRPLVRMPDGRIALARHLDALDAAQRLAWTSRVVVPLT